MRFLLVVFDGLRADHVTPGLMPRLCALRRRGRHFPNSRAVFPSETRVNQASLVTGCHPARHGIVGNKFFDRRLRPEGMLNTARYEQLDAAAGRGGLLAVPSLGELLHRAGGSLAVAGCGTPGGNRLLHLDAARLGGVNVSLHGPERSATPEMLAAMAEKIGPVPPDRLPDSARIAWLADAYMDYLATEVDATVTILWLSEPDRSYHYRGVDSRSAHAGIRAGDAAVGRLLDWRERAAPDLNIVVLSDHGHLTAVGAPLAVAARLERAGFAGCDVVQSLCGAIWLNGADPAAVAGWLAGQPWCGPLFTRLEVEGCFRQSDVHLDHSRAADIVYVLAQSMRAEPGAPPGSGRHDNVDIPAGGGLHGGLTPAELNNVLVLDGPAFGPAGVDATPAGIIDIAPTILRRLGIDGWQAMDGRDLVDPAAGARTERWIVASDRHRLALARVGMTGYLDHARVAN